MVEPAAIQALADEIASKFDVERIILFGSYAYGTPTEDSDVDLLVIMRFDGRASDAAHCVSCGVSHDFARDLLVRTPGDTQRRYAQFDPLVREALDQGKVLVERDRQRVGA